MGVQECQTLQLIRHYAYTKHKLSYHCRYADDWTRVQAQTVEKRGERKLRLQLSSDEFTTGSAEARAADASHQALLSQSLANRSYPQTPCVSYGLAHRSEDGLGYVTSTIVLRWAGEPGMVLKYMNYSILTGNGRRSSNVADIRTRR